MITKIERRIKIKYRVRNKVSGTAARPRMSVFRSCEQAAKVGELIAKKAIEAGISTVVFDRNGYLYHGRIKEVAEAARKAGLNF